MKESVGALMVRAVMNSAIKIKTPRSAAAVLPGNVANLNLSEIAAKWDAARVRLRLLLEPITDATANNALFRHPISGRMTGEQGIRFIRAHFQHHGGQIKRGLAPSK